MKEKIGEFARGIFEYTSPEVVVSEENISKGIPVGENYYGNIKISNSASSIIKGVIYSSSDMVITDVGSFAGRENEIRYCVRSNECMSGEVIKGKLMIVSDCGEIDVPYNFIVEKPVFKSGLGDVKDLFQFANLAKMDEVEALKLFTSSQFENTFLAKDVKYSLIYNSLMKGKNVNVAMEEFMVATHKKAPVNISVDKRKLEYNVGEEDFRDKIIIDKDTWGYCEVMVRCEGIMLKVSKDKITSDDFIGNKAELDVVINSKAIRAGKNYGRIILESIGNKISIDVICTKKHTSSVDLSSNRYKNFVSKFVKNYIDFRTEKISLDKYVTDSEAIINNICILTDLGVSDLIKIHLMLISGRTKKAKELMEIFREGLENKKNPDVVSYCGYMYLETMMNKDVKELGQVVDRIKEYYFSTHHTWQLLWLLLYMDKKYDDNPRAAFEDIKDQLATGCTSPIIYYEACNILGQDINLLGSIDRQDRKILYWGAKTGCISKKLSLEIASRALKKSEFDNLLFKTLKILYEKYKQEDVLTAICSMLIKGQKVGPKYFNWYKEGVEHQLKITQLHEMYMYSYDVESREPFPNSLLLYFSYNSNLSDRKKAFLYARIIKNKASAYSTYKNYRKIIEKFMFKQIKARIINEDMKVIYEEFLSPDIIDEELAVDLPYIMFRYDISCYNPNFKGVVVVNRMVESEYYAPFVEGKAQINIYTDDSEVFLIDRDDNRYVRANSYTMKKLLNSEMYVEKCYELNMSNEMLILHIAEQIDTMAREDSFNVQARKRLLEIPGLRKEYERKCQYNLIQYCHDNREVELLDAYLNQTDVNHLSKRERSYIVEYYILRGFYHKALDAVSRFGFGIVPAKRIHKLAKSIINTDLDNSQTEGLICEMCIYIFRQGRYDDITLGYLVEHFNGSTGEMFDLWKECVKNKIECVDLEERVLGQILFAETFPTDSYELFISYYGKGTDKRLIKAYLKYNAYKYLVKDRVIANDIFAIMAKELTMDKNEICTLAMLKFYSNQDGFDKTESAFIQHHINYFATKGVILPFFKSFAGKIEIPEYICDKHYIEYNADPSINVKIHYMLDDSSDFKDEVMKDVFMGIRVKEFMLFYGEHLQYYIVEESVKGDKITESFNVSASNKLEENYSRYSMINTILMARELEDDTTVLDTVKEIAVADYLADNLFKPRF